MNLFITAPLRLLHVKSFFTAQKAKSKVNRLHIIGVDSVRGVSTRLLIKRVNCPREDTFLILTLLMCHQQ